MLRTIGIQSGESVESVPIEEKEGYGEKDLQKRKVLSLAPAERYSSGRDSNFTVFTSVSALRKSSHAQGDEQTEKVMLLRPTGCTIAHV